MTKWCMAKTIDVWLFTIIERSTIETTQSVLSASVDPRSAPDRFPRSRAVTFAGAGPGHTVAPTRGRRETPSGTPLHAHHRAAGRHAGWFLRPRPQAFPPSSATAKLLLAGWPWQQRGHQPPRVATHGFRRPRKEIPGAVHAEVGGADPHRKPRGFLALKSLSVRTTIVVFVINEAN